jgi:hypothetical protein
VGTDADLNVASLGAVGDRHLVDMYDRQPPQCGCGAAVMISSLLYFFRRYAGSPRTCLACPVAVGSIYPTRPGNEAIA